MENCQPPFESAVASLSGKAYFDCTKSTKLSFGGFAQYTLEAWINLDDVNGTNAIISRFNGGVAAEYSFWVANGKLVSYRNVGPWTVESHTRLEPCNWYHVATSYDGTKLNLYINGTLEISVPFTSQPGFADLETLVGAQLGGGKIIDQFKGILTEVRIWNICRTPEQIRSGMPGVNPASAGLVACLNFNTGAVQDVSVSQLEVNTHGQPVIAMWPDVFKMGGKALKGSVDAALQLGGLSRKP